MIDKFYKKLFIENQGKGKYLMFTFDIKDSKLMESKVRLIAQYQIIELVERIYQDLIMLEKELDKEILIHDINYKKIMDGCDNTFAHRHEPFILGDMVGITILTNSIPPEVVLSIFDLNKKELDITFDFHISYGNYETDDYGLGGVEAFRGYAITILSNAHKSSFKDLNLKYERTISDEELNGYMNLIEINHLEAVKKAKSYLGFDETKYLSKTI